MKLSIVSPILNSHEIVRRQLLHYERMETVPWDDVELVWVDDGSDPPLQEVHRHTLLRTNNATPWSEHAARNKGVDAASGEWVFVIDIDYIIPERAILDLLEVLDEERPDRVNIRRFLGVLDEEGVLREDRKTLAEWKAKPIWMRRPVPGHRSQFVMKKKVFRRLGGYREDLAGAYHGRTGGGAGQDFYFRWRALENRTEVSVSSWRVKVYMFPCGKYCVDGDENPSGLFHDLRREHG